MLFKQILLNIYRSIFLHKIFYNLNFHIYKLSLRGIGILNSEGGNITGENYLLDLLAKKFTIKIIFDVGANDGGYSITLRENFPHSKIFAFEPHPESFEKLKKISKQFKILCFEIGLNDKIEKSKIWDFADNAILKYTQPTSTLASLYKDVITDYHQQGAKSFQIQLTTLDRIAAENKVDGIDFLKIDTEGNELKILKGAKALISHNKIKFIQFEFNEMNIYSKSYFKDFVDLLDGYEFFRLMPNGLFLLGPYRPIMYEIFGFQNILAVHRSMLKDLKMFIN